MWLWFDDNFNMWIFKCNRAKRVVWTLHKWMQVEATRKFLDNQRKAEMAWSHPYTIITIRTKLMALHTWCKNSVFLWVIFSNKPIMSLNTFSEIVNGWATSGSFPFPLLELQTVWDDVWYAALLCIAYVPYSPALGTASTPTNARRLHRRNIWVTTCLSRHRSTPLLICVIHNIVGCGRDQWRCWLWSVPQGLGLESRWPWQLQPYGNVQDRQGLQSVQHEGIGLACMWGIWGMRLFDT